VANPGEGGLAPLRNGSPLPALECSGSLTYNSTVSISGRL
jgi:hypothetical protein